MKLYFIRRKSDHRYLRSRETYYSAHVGRDKTAWSDKPAYILRTPDGVASNLRKLCSTPKKVQGTINRLEWVNFDPSKLDLYEVVVVDALIVGEKALPASDFLVAEDTTP